MPDPIRILELRSVRGTGGGPEKTILLGAARSDALRFKVTVCYIRDRRDGIFRIHERARALGVDYVDVTERNSFDPAIWPALTQLVIGRAIDIVHSHDYKTNLLALMLSYRLGVIPLTTAHGWAGTSLREHLYYVFDRRLIGRFPSVIAVSEEIRQTLIAAGAQPGVVRRIPNGIDAAVFTRDDRCRERIRAELSLPSGSVVIGSVGRLEPVKRFDLLLEAAARMKRDVSPFIIIAGAGSCRASLAAFATHLGIADRVRLLGHRDDARDVHQAFDVFVQSSDSEGIPNTVLEAMALETPIVATDVGGTRELIDDAVHGLLVPAGNAAALAHAIEQTLDGPDDAVNRVRRARQRVEGELSFDARMAAVERVYVELLNEHRKARPTADPARAM